MCIRWLSALLGRRFVIGRGHVRNSQTKASNRFALGTLAFPQAPLRRSSRHNRTSSSAPPPATAHLAFAPPHGVPRTSGAPSPSRPCAHSATCPHSTRRLRVRASSAAPQSLYLPQLHVSARPSRSTSHTFASPHSPQCASRATPASTRSRAPAFAPAHRTSSDPAGALVSPTCAPTGPAPAHPGRLQGCSGYSRVVGCGRQAGRANCLPKI